MEAIAYDSRVHLPACLLLLVSMFTETLFISHHVMHLFVYFEHLVCTFSFSIIFCPLKLLTFINQTISFFSVQTIFLCFLNDFFILSPMIHFENFLKYLTLLITATVVTITKLTFIELSLCSGPVLRMVQTSLSITIRIFLRHIFHSH